MKRINTRKELVDLAKELGVSHDWHEPDEQGITVEVHGNHFDNAGFWPAGDFNNNSEKYVFIKKDGHPMAAVNLATLFAWAAGYENDKEVSELDKHIETERVKHGLTPREIGFIKRAWKAAAFQFQKATK